MEIKIIQHTGPEYEQMKNLRIRDLLEPVGVPASYIQPEKEKDDLLIGAFDNGRIIGCCVLTPRTPDLVQLRQMVVDTTLQGKGVGAAIVSFAEKIAKEKGFNTLMMHARNPVIGFYEKSGYEIVGEEFFEVGIGHHKMQKEL